MVQLTNVLMKYMPHWFQLPMRNGGRYFKKYNLYRMTGAFYGRNRNTYKNAVNKWTKKIEYENRDRPGKKIELRDLFSQRLVASCREHDYPFHLFITALPMMNIELDRKTLSNLAIWEPRTFKSLIELAKEFHHVNQRNPLMDHRKPVSVISRGMLKES
ncbi:50S ribosomal protein L20-like [Panonychus citri]|uniref:50S ribosomal protein L20-like n=1 Tax=Panonychus citri TaxID=50023 RepID=UPI0023077613|nr:50S ribosomal protein L20-like [Panonychus citri]